MDILASRVTDADVTEAFRRKPDVAAVLVSHDGCPSRSVVTNELLESFSLRVCDRNGADFVILVADTDDNDLADRAATRVQLVLGLGLFVLLLTAHVGLIDLNVIAHVAVFVLQP